MIELLLPVKREMVEIFVGEDFAQETWSPEAAVDDLRFCGFDDGRLKVLIPRDAFGAYRALDVEVAGFFP